jgi:hypothetical protein
MKTPMKLSQPAFRILLALFCGMILIAPAYASSARKVKLPAAGKSIRIESTIKGVGVKKLFVFHATSGTKLKIELSGAGPLRGVLLYPSGHQDGSPGGVIFDDTLTETGKYHLQVTESSMGDAWSGKFAVELSVAP